MRRFNQFSSENLLMSVGGHLLLVALLLVSATLVIERAKMVAPDRIQIMEIDLNYVRVAGNETVLQNTDIAPTLADAAEKEPLTPPSQPQSEPVPVPEQVMPDSIKSSSMVDDVATGAPAKEKPRQDVTAPVPKKKTVVRVNREVMSLDRTLTVSVVDALRVALTRCWVVDTSYPGAEDIRAVAHLTMRKNGTVRDVWFESAAREETDAAFAYVLSTVRDAINACQPFSMLPPGEFAKWEKIQLTFYPAQGKVM